MIKTEGRRMEQAERVLARASDRYVRRENRFYGRVAGWEALYFSRQSAMALVKEARDLVGRLESMVYDGVAL